MKFTGHERDLGNTTSTADDLDYMHARFYNMQIGRFTAFDPIGGNPWAPQSWNRYAYVMGNPLKFTDPAGLLPVGFASAIYVASSQFVFFDESTVSASPSSSSSAGRSMDQASFLNFLFGNHAGAGSFGAGTDSARDPFRLSFTERVLAAIPEQPAQAVGEAIIGFGDTLSLGLTGWVRHEQGLEDTISTGSAAYRVGEAAGWAHGAALGIAGAARLSGSKALFGRTARLNRGKWLRVGHSGHKGKTYFSVRGKAIDKITRQERAHIDLWRIKR